MTQEVQLTFPSGLIERSESFVLIYRNQFGLTAMAYREPGEHLVGFLAPEVQTDWGDLDPNWPDGTASGVFAPEEEGN